MQKNVTGKRVKIFNETLETGEVWGLYYTIHCTTEMGSFNWMRVCLVTYTIHISTFTDGYWTSAAPLLLVVRLKQLMFWTLECWSCKIMAPVQHTAASVATTGLIPQEADIS